MDDTKYDIPIGIPEFYKGRSIFVTGFTGYIGKLLVEKLLYSCPEIEKIYVLIRNKRKGQTTQGRAEENFKSRAFLRLREKYPGALESKVIALAGDVTEERLGLSQEHEELLRKEVSVIFHGAASVRFDDPLREAVHMNTLGAKKMVDLALTMTKLVCLTFISTAYSNCDRIHIKEELYKPKADWKKTLEICKNVDPASLEILHKKYIGRMPNTYTYSKSLAEQVFNDYRDRLPVVIVRPAIVLASRKEPMPGWTDNKYGPMGVVIGGLLGLVRCGWVDLKQKCNYIPSDVVVNAVIVAAWKTALTRNPEVNQDSTTVYNVCSPLSYNLTHEDFHNVYKQKETMAAINTDGTDFICIKFYSTEFWFKVHNLYMHVLPAYIVDLVMVLNQRKPMLVSIRRKIFGAALALSYFSTTTFTFETNNFDNLLEQINPRDKDSFGWKFDVDEFYFTYHCCYCLVRHTILKPLYDDLETNKKRLRMLYVIDRFFVYLTYSLGAFIFYRFSIIQVALSTLLSIMTLP